MTYFVALEHSQWCVCVISSQASWWTSLAKVWRLGIKRTNPIMHRSQLGDICPDEDKELGRKQASWGKFGAWIWRLLRDGGGLGLR